MIEFFKKLFFPISYYRKRFEALRNRFLEETEKDKLLASFAKSLLPLHRYFCENNIEDRWVVVSKYQFDEVYKMGVMYYMGMRLFWI